MYQIKDSHFISKKYQDKQDVINEWQTFMLNNKEQYKLDDIINLYHHNELIYQWKIVEGKDKKFLTMMHDNGYSGYLEIVPVWQ